MNIILDSNVFRSNFFLSGYGYEILFDYLERTDSKIIMPRIVYEEVLSQYRKQIVEAFDNYNKGIDALNKVMIKRRILEEINENKINQYVDEYRVFFKNKLSITESSIIEYKEGYLNEIVRRAVNRIKPTKSDGKDFRDSLIWISIMDYAKSINKPIAFISDNVSDFADDDKIELNRNLQGECKDRDIEIFFSKSIKDFVEKQSNHFKFVDETWLGEQLDWFDFQNEMMEYLGSSDVEEQLITFYNKRNKQVVDAIEFIEIDEFLGAKDTFVYEMRNGELMVSALVKTSIWIDVEYVIEVPALELDPPYDFEYVTNSEKVKCNFYLTIKIINRIADSIDISRVKFY